MQFLSGRPTLNLWRIPFGGPEGLVRTVFARPLDLIDHLRSGNRPWYVWQMTAPVACAFARAPVVVAIGSLVLLGNVVSTFHYQHDVTRHYSLVIVPPLVMGTAYAIGALRANRRFVAVGIVSVAALGRRTCGGLARIP